MRKLIIHTNIDQEAQERRRMRKFINLSDTERLRELFELMKLSMSLEPLDENIDFSNRLKIQSGRES